MTPWLGSDPPFQSYQNSVSGTRTRVPFRWNAYQHHRHTLRSILVFLEGALKPNGVDPETWDFDCIVQRPAD